MPHWLIKSALQRAISWLPQSHLWNLLFQQYVTRSLDLNAGRFELRVEACQRHLEALRSAAGSTPASSFTAVEVGTGWYPVVPIGLFLCGASEVWSFDIAPLLSRPRLLRVFARFDEYAQSGALASHLPGIQPERLAQMRELAKRAEKARSPVEILEELNIHVRVQGAERTGLPSRSIDLFASTGVLEYIPREVLKLFLAEFRRIGTPQAVQSHYLNLVDQYWYFDKSISPINFLKYSSRQWKYLNSPLTWLNRLRICDYRDLFAESAFEIIREDNRSGSIADLERIHLAPEFKNHSQADLLVYYSWVVARSKSPR